MLIGGLEGKPADFQANWICRVRKRLIVLIDLDWTPGKPFRGPCTNLRKEQNGLKMTNQIYKIMTISFSANSFVKSAGIENERFYCWTDGHAHRAAIELAHTKMNEQALIFLTLHLTTQHISSLSSTA